MDKLRYIFIIIAMVTNAVAWGEEREVVNVWSGEATAAGTVTTAASIESSVFSGVHKGDKFVFTCQYAGYVGGTYNYATIVVRDFTSNVNLYTLATSGGDVTISTSSSEMTYEVTIDDDDKLSSLKSHSFGINIQYITLKNVKIVREIDDGYTVLWEGSTTYTGWNLSSGSNPVITANSLSNLKVGDWLTADYTPADNNGGTINFWYGSTATTSFNSASSLTGSTYTCQITDGTILDKIKSEGFCLTGYNITVSRVCAVSGLWCGPTTWDSSNTGQALVSVSANDLSSLAVGDKLPFVFELADNDTVAVLDVIYSDNTSETFTVTNSPFKLLIDNNRLAKISSGFSVACSPQTAMTLISIGKIETGTLDADVIYDDADGIWTTSKIRYAQLPNGSLNFSPLKSLKTGDRIHFNYSYMNGSKYASIGLWDTSRNLGSPIYAIENPSSVGTDFFTVYDEEYDDVKDLVLTYLSNDKFNIALDNMCITKIWVEHVTAETASTPKPTGSVTTDGDRTFSNFKESTAIISNPERGVVHQQELHSDGRSNTNLTIKKVRNWRRNENITYVRELVYLEKYFDGTQIDDDYLKTITTDLDAIRAGGAKCVLRFAYSTDTEKLDPSLSIIESHISQIKTAVFDKYSDIISVLEAGFIGTWGEWYYTNNDAKASRKEVLDALLTALPGRFVSVRTPSYKYRLFDKDATSYATADTYNSSDNYYRVGAHNDAFISSTDNTDMGTFGSGSRSASGGTGEITSAGADADRTFWEYDTKYTPMGGETSQTSDVESLYTKALTEMSSFHYSYINEDWYSGFVSRWKATATTDTSSPTYADGDTYWNTMEKRLGYRFVVTGAQITERLQGSSSPLHVQFNIRNDGYATPFNSRPLKVVLLKEGGNNTYSIVKTLDATDNHFTGSSSSYTTHSNSNTDPRRWWSGETTTVSMYLDVGDLANGDYTVAIELPDANESFSSDMHYSIRFANDSTWLEVDNRGMNLIGYTYMGEGYTHEIKETAWNSWATEVNCQKPADTDGTKMYIVTAASVPATSTAATEATGTVTLVEVDDAYYDTPLLLNGTVGSHTFPIIRGANVSSSTASDLSNNILRYVGSGETVDGTSDVYVLYNGDKGVGFYLWSGDALTERTVYLPASALTSSTAAKPSFIALTRSTSTGINTPVSDPSGNGQENIWYNLQGQRVSTPRHGIYIKGGKKVVVD